MFALIVGINEYASPDISNLQGAVADADAMNDFLVSTLGVPARQVMNLRNQQATRDAIVSALSSFTSYPNIKKGDPILFFYAGHGARVDASAGLTNESVKIKMLVPYDFTPCVPQLPMKGKVFWTSRSAIFCQRLPQANQTILYVNICPGEL